MTTPERIPSPCKNLCNLAEDESHCTDCLRTLREITTWTQMNNDQRRAVWDAIERRQAEQGAE
ncbi:DUF1289 domain-containing protein [Alkalilimnicola sp. S0819]|uniref:DUF1289 domain-containing protein n=1 Tax=Alkalilimnicola sp. S0819 TaxID=2613922 RepID=UPI00126243F1|nr:DUF1289 domain-containing protein [Alkalilimnicola sp. S0819]KAB7622802.1 DUF1289 domain-containing protein [Alkalilimnicola sp. S0819]MPQ17298.1 DUF1289 domain-containing protein [Alkalilimnicola sp. S0819]